MKGREREGRKVIPIPIQDRSTKGEKTNKHKSRQADTLAVRERIRKLRDNVKQAKPLGAEASWRNEGQMEVVVGPKRKQTVVVSPGELGSGFT